MMKNLEIAKLLYELADLHEIEGMQWEPRAFRSAAQIIENMPKPIEEIYETGGEKAILEMPKIGKGIAKKIIQYLEKGKIDELEEFRKKVPKGVSDLLKVQGLGPKKVKKLYKDLNIKSMKELERAAKQGRIKGLEGFGEKSEKEILESLKTVKNTKHNLGDALYIGRDILKKLTGLKEVKNASIAGSLRRMNETIGDIDILAVSENASKVMDFFTKLPDVKKILAKGQTKSSVLFQSGIQSDLRVIRENSFGAAMNYFTGSKTHNIHLRQIAIKKEFKLSEYGLFNKEGKQVAGKTEEEIYQKLGLNYIEPELRENTGEIEHSRKLPKLVCYDSLKGDLHMHTKHSDGNNTIEEMALSAKKLGYKYLAITDHSKSLKVANGMNEESVKRMIKEVEKVNSKIKGITLLKGSEVDILEDGSLDYDDAILKKLDVVIASVHQRYKLDAARQTKRLIKAITNPYVNILGHPSGRRINSRAPMEFDLKEVAKAAKENRVALEINAQQERLDLKPEHIRLAKEQGCMFVINSDAHHKEGLSNIELGIGQARRGWLESKDIINTRSLAEIKKFLRKK